MDLVLGCENRLGWTPTTRGRPFHVARGIEVGKLKKAMAQDPTHCTIENLALALEWSWRHRKQVSSPVGLIYRIDAALERAPEVDCTTDLGAAVQRAVDHELALDRPDALEWIYRLTRSFGTFRADVLTEWKEAGRE